MDWSASQRPETHVIQGCCYLINSCLRRLYKAYRPKRLKNTSRIDICKPTPLNGFYCRHPSPSHRHTKDCTGHHHGKNHRFHGLPPHRRGLRAGCRAREELPRICHCARARAGAPTSGALHGLRHAVLQQRLPGQQPDPRLQRAGVPGRLEARYRHAAQHQQLSGVHRPHLPRAV